MYFYFNQYDDFRNKLQYYHTDIKWKMHMIYIDFNLFPGVKEINST